MALRLRPAEVEDCDVLGTIALAAKGYWGYSREFLEGCRAELAVTEDDLPGIVVADRDEEAVGWYQLLGDPPEGVLDDLWVRPDVIGTGLGRLLWTDAVSAAAARGLRTLRVEADPFAESFYLAMGAERVGLATSSSIPDREIPLLRFDVLATGHQD